MAMVARLPAIGELNALTKPEFAAAMAPLFEGAPQFLLRLAIARPFATYADLWPRALAIARSLPEADQLELINAHPRFGAPPADRSRRCPTANRATSVRRPSSRPAGSRPSSNG